MHVLMSSLPFILSNCVMVCHDVCATQRQIFCLHKALAVLSLRHYCKASDQVPVLLKGNNIEQSSQTTASQLGSAARLQWV